MIGVFDSGIGGLTLLASIQKILPKQSYIYYADTDHVPYSYKTPDEIRGYVENAFLFLREKGCKIVVLACNTATNVAVEYLREKYDFPIVAIQPAVKVASDHNSEGKKIIVCATPVTLASKRYLTLVETLGIKNSIVNIPLPKLVSFAEKGIFEGEEVLTYLQDAFQDLNLSEYKNIVLGCTHFTFFEKFIEDNFPPLQAVDGNEGTAKRVLYILEKEKFPLEYPNPNTQFYQSGRVSNESEKYIGYLKTIRNT
ncbi:MAG: glutamate racemase [Leadbetterella sp.]